MTMNQQKPQVSKLAAAMRITFGVAFIGFALSRENPAWLKLLEVFLGSVFIAAGTIEFWFIDSLVGAFLVRNRLLVAAMVVIIAIAAVVASTA